MPTPENPMAQAGPPRSTTGVDLDAEETYSRILPAPAAPPAPLTTARQWPTALEWRETLAMAQGLAGSSLVPADLRGRPEDVMVVLLTGRELGLQPMYALRNVYVLEGRPSLSADGISAICQASPLCLEWRILESTADRATIRVHRYGRDPQTFTWTAEEAKRAGLFDRGKDPAKNNWNRYPRQMLVSRVSSEAGREVFPDVLGGFYSREELQDEDNRTTSNALPPGAVVAFPTNEQAIKERVVQLRAAIQEAEDKRDLAALQQIAGRLKLEPSDVRAIVAPIYRDAREKIYQREATEFVERLQKDAP